MTEKERLEKAATQILVGLLANGFVGKIPTKTSKQQAVELAVEIARLLVSELDSCYPPSDI